MEQDKSLKLRKYNVRHHESRSVLIDVKKKLILAFKVLRSMTPEYLNVFSFVSQIGSKTRRSIDSGILYLPKFRTEYH